MNEWINELINEWMNEWKWLKMIFRRVASLLWSVVGGGGGKTAQMMNSGYLFSGFLKVKPVS